MRATKTYPKLILSHFSLSLIMSLNVICYLGAESATAAPSEKTVRESGVSSYSGDLKQSTPFCDFAFDPVTAAMRAGYLVQDGSPESWEQDQNTPPGHGSYVYVGSFFGPEYSDSSGTEFDPYDVVSYNARAGSVVKRVCKWVKGWFRCFSKNDPDHPSPPRKTPGEVEAEEALLKKRCAALAGAAFISCIGCGCADCDRYSESYVYRECMGGTPSIRPEYNCALDCQLTNPLPPLEDLVPDPAAP
jgi:hypothetical protein